MSEAMETVAPVGDSIASGLPIPPFPVETPCFVIIEERVRSNLRATAAQSGGIGRLMPHIKTHRAPWIVRLMTDEGVRAFKAATPAEVEIAIEGGASLVVWAYPTVNAASIHRVADTARRHRAAEVHCLVDSREGLEVWRAELQASPVPNLRLRIDLDPGLGRTGLPISVDALDLALRISEMGLFGGWHLYDGHVQDVVSDDRERRLAPIIAAVRNLMGSASKHGISTDLIAGGSYSYNIWPADVAKWVSPGSFTYSSSQHDSDLPGAGWQIAAYVLSTVLSMRDGTATLDAGSKAISPDIPLVKRFVGAGAIRFMKEEHAVVDSSHLHIGDRLPLVPRHACTAAYLYSRALVRLIDGTWEYRDQLGARRESVGALDT